MITTGAVYAQNTFKVVGKVSDSTKKALANVTVKLYTEKDSTKTITDKKGDFSFSNIETKHITLKISSVGLSTYIAKYEINSDMKEIDVGNIILKSGEINLMEVVIKAKPVAIKYKQDTVEYNARAFNVQEDDRVTDLLKQLPGVEIDENENVTAMGKSMTKLRVNGKDFFTSDVKEFISKLPAEIVDKIQVIDDFGDEANFTGVKLGEPSKMLNIVTKPGMNKGKFGSVSLKAGTNNQIGTNGSINFWKDTQQITTGIGHDIGDNGAGINKNSRASIGYNDAINKKSNFGFNYRYGGGSNNNQNTQLIETINTLGKLNSQIENLSSTNNNTNNLNSNYNLTTKKIYLRTSFNAGYNNNESISNSLNYQNGFIKQDFKNNANNNSSSPFLNANLNFSKKLNKVTLSGNFSFSTSSNNSNRNIITNTLYYDTLGVLKKDSLLNRNIYNNTNNKQFGFSTNYIFSLKKDSLVSKSISLNYNGSIRIAEGDLQTYVLNAGALEPIIIDSLSNNTKNSSINQSINANYNQYNKRYRLSAGINIAPNLIQNYYPNLNTTYRNTYINLSPIFNYSNTINDGKSISINYNGRNSNPTITQLQPIKNTQNLQNIIVGNPDIKSAFNHSISSSFNYFNKKTNLSFQTGLNFNTVTNEIINNIILIPDTLGAYKQETHFENVNGNYNASMNYSINIPFESRKYTISFNGNFGQNKKTAMINGDKISNKGYNFSQNINGSYTIKKFNTSFQLGYSMTTNNNNNFDISAGLNLIPYNMLLNTGQSFFKTQSINASYSASLRLKTVRLGFNGNFVSNRNDNASNNNTQSYTFGSYGEFTFFKTYQFNYNVNKRITRGYSLTQINPLVINIGMQKSFLKSKSLYLNLNASDLLNEGNNVSQTIQGNSIIENRSNQIMRVISLGLSYNLSNFGGKNYKLRTD
jgi:hypothetical protein